MAMILCSFVLGSFYLSYGVVVQQSMTSHPPPSQPYVNHETVASVTVTKRDAATAIQQQQQRQPPAAVNTDKCAFRSYPKSRLYGLHDKSQPNFLSSDATYIRGKLPILLNPVENDDKLMIHLANGSSSSNNNNSNNNIIQQSTPVKPCFDTTSWETLWDESTNTDRLPFTDGHNPSIVSLATNPYDQRYDTQQQQQGYVNNNNNNNQHVRLDPKHVSPIALAFPEYSLDNLFLGVTIFGNGQCKFGLSKEEIITYNFSTYTDPPDGKRTVIALLLGHDISRHHPTNNKQQQQQQQQQKPQHPFQILAQTTLLLERDVMYGTKRQKIAPEANKGERGGYTRIHQEFDDPRFFFHEGRLWILYRNGPLFGYHDQIHNPIHFEMVSSDDNNNNEEEGEEGGGGGGGVNNKFIAYVKASETVRVCCGRNIALISEEVRVVDDGSSSNNNDNNNNSGKREVEWMPSGGLKALTWVDPVTVVDVDLGDVITKLKSRQLSEWDDDDKEEVGLTVQSETSTHRRLGSSAKPKSNIHGTNGYLVPLPSSGELLGIAHFHRPEHRKESNYALHGHHYTHAFFTIARQHQSKNGGDGANAGFKLKRISNEFLFRTLSVPIGEKEPSNDGDIIQFASGLDVYGSDIDGKLVLSYGINDCEGAVLTISMQKLQQMLIEVEPGQEVVDLMRKAER